MVNRNHPVTGWFLTYPRCDLSTGNLFDHLCTLGSVKEYVIAHELHEDGGNHLHAYVRYDVGIKPRDMACFDVGDYHGNYQSARSPKAVVKYCTKEDDYITNIDIKSYLSKKGKVTAAILREKTAARALEDGDISFMQVRQYKLARLEVSLQPYTHTDVRGVWIWGPPGIGKSRAVREKFPELYDKSQNKWWDGYEGQDTVLLDDFDDRKSCLGHYLKRWMDRYSCQGEVKGGTLHLKHHRFIVTSNYSIAECFEDDTMATAIRRRCTVIHYETVCDDIWSYVPGPFSPNFNHEGV